MLRPYNQGMLRKRATPTLALRLAIFLGCWLGMSSLGTAQNSNTPPNNALQQAVTRAMRGKAGTAAVVDVASGKILASYHSEVAARRLALPGSSIKPFTLLALIEAGKVNGQTTLMCKRPLKIAGHNFDCSHPETAQPFDAVAALAYSCNTFFTSMATRLTPAELRENFLRAGLGSASGFAANEATGVVALASDAASLQMQAIGEADIHVTPLELLRAYQRLAQMQPKHDATLDPLFAGLNASVAYGMGHLAQPKSALVVAGKTGTSLVEEGSWRHAWFGGYAPAANPEIALVVFLEKGTGPVDAAAVAEQIFAAYAASRTAGGASH
jgi:penicillin-binding protein 2